MTIKGLLRAAGIPLGGAIRAQLSRAIDDALFAVWEKACEIEDGESAALILFGIVSHDPTFRPPLWLRYRFAAHRAAITTAVQNGDIRHVRWGLE